MVSLGRLVQIYASRIPLALKSESTPMSPQAIIGFVLKLSIMLTVFGFGLQASRHDLLYLLQRPRVLLRSLLAMFVVVPLFVIDCWNTQDNWTKVLLPCMASPLTIY